MGNTSLIENIRKSGTFIKILLSSANVGTFSDKHQHSGIILILPVPCIVQKSTYEPTLHALEYTHISCYVFRHPLSVRTMISCNTRCGDT
jgi:hypothetical protein